MKKCNSCNIKFNTKYRFCPLCQNRLIGNQYDDVFPTNRRLKVNALLMKYILFISLVIVIISCFIELYIYQKINYSHIIAGILMTNYIIIHFTLKNRKNVLSLLGKYGFLLIVISLLWYFWIRSTIIVNYVIPGICICELLFNMTTFIILKSKYVVNYFSIILLNIVILVLPVVLIMLNLTTNNLLSYICFILALIILLWLIIFYYEDIKEELEKFFNL